MGDAIGQLLPFAVGIAISPMPIIALVLVLVSPRGRVAGPAFLTGWFAGLVLVGALLLVLAGPADPSEGGEPADWVSGLNLVLGLVLVALAVKQWRGRPQVGVEPEPPGWMAALDTITPLRAAGLGVVLGSVNPKCFVFIMGGVAAVAQTEIPGSEQAIAWAVFVVIASIGVAVPIAVSVALGARARDVLGRLQAWMAQNNAVIMAVMFLLLGVQLVGDAISGLSG
jgi:threonine/homoserine/homoserine lactone efflux protein